MTLDTRISTAIQGAVRNADQPPDLASILSTWMGRVMDGAESADNRDALMRLVDALYDSVQLPPIEED